MNGLEALNEIKDPQASKWYLKRLDIIESELKVAKILKEKRVDVAYIEECADRYNTIEEALIEYNENQWTNNELTQDEFTAIVEWLKGE